MYVSDEELFAAIITDTKLEEHPQFMSLTACASTILAAGTGALDHLTHEEFLFTTRKLGFALATHDEVRLVREFVQLYRERRSYCDEEARKVPWQPFEVLFYRDRHGRPMARFSMGTTTFRPTRLSEAWEVKFASVYHDALAEALKLGVGNVVHESEDAEGGDADAAG